MGCVAPGEKKKGTFICIVMEKFHCHYVVSSFLCVTRYSHLAHC